MTPTVPQMPPIEPGYRLRDGLARTPGGLIVAASALEVEGSGAGDGPPPAPAPNHRQRRLMKQMKARALRKTLRQKRRDKARVLATVERLEAVAARA